MFKSSPFRPLDKYLLLTDETQMVKVAAAQEMERSPTNRSAVPAPGPRGLQVGQPTGKLRNARWLLRLLSCFLY